MSKAPLQVQRGPLLAVAVLAACSATAAPEPRGVLSRRPEGGCPIGRHTCTQSEYAAYAGCLARSCRAGYERCFGDSYARQQFTGPCAEMAACLMACPCGDAAECEAACPASDDCTRCMVSSFGDCGVFDCEKPDCYAPPPT